MKYMIYVDELLDERDCAEYIVDNSTEVEDAFDQMLDEIYGTVSIAGYEYDSSYALHEIDETAYRCAFNEYTSDLTYEIIEDLLHMEPGDEQEFYGYDVTCVDDEEDDEEEE